MLVFINTIILLAIAIPFVVLYSFFHFLEQLIFSIVSVVDKINDELPVLLRVITGLMGVAFMFPTMFVLFLKAISFVILKVFIKDFKEFMHGNNKGRLIS